MKYMSKESLIDAVYRVYGDLGKVLSELFGYKIVNESNNRTTLVCPHHSSKSNNRGANCYVLDGKTLFCHSCGHQGGLYEALAINLGCSKEDAKEWIAEKIGYTLKKADIQQATIVDIRKKYCALAHKYFDADKNKEVYQYLAKRGVGKRMVTRFGIGYIDSWHEINAMKKMGYTDTQLKETGIIAVSKKSGKEYPAFMNRIILMAGDNIYGRSFGRESDLPHLYSKGTNKVFNLNTNLPTKTCGEPKDIVFVVESIFDAISTQAYINGLHENWGVVATLGTHGVKDEELVPILQETKAQEIVLIPDSDPWKKPNGVAHAVGQKAGLKKAKMFEQAGVNVRVMVLPEDSDPNDIAKRRESLAMFRQMVDKSLTVVQYQLYCMSHYFDLATMGGKQSFAQRSKKVLLESKISLKKPLVEWVAKLIGVDMDELAKFYSQTLKNQEVIQTIKGYLAKGYKVEDIVKNIASRL